MLSNFVTENYGYSYVKTLIKKKTIIKPDCWLSECICWATPFRPGFYGMITSTFVSTTIVEWIAEEAARYERQILYDSAKRIELARGEVGFLKALYIRKNFICTVLVLLTPSFLYEEICFPKLQSPLKPHYMCKVAVHRPVIWGSMPR